MNFRYHILSLTAVFVALAVGLVLGTAARNGPAAQTLTGQADAVGQQNQNLKSEVSRLAEDLARERQLTEDLAPTVLDGRLTGVGVALIFGPGTADQLAGIVSTLTAADATIVGRITLTDAFSDPARRDDLLDLAVAALPPTVSGGLPADTDGLGASAALLGSILLNRKVTERDRRSVLAAYQSQQYLAIDEPVTARAAAVVLVTASPATGAGADRRNLGMLTAASQLAGVGPLLIAGPSETGTGNLISLARAQAALAKKISTVDNIGAPEGRLVLAWALADHLAGHPGHYGRGAGARRLPAATS